MKMVETRKAIREHDNTSETNQTQEWDVPRSSAAF